MSRNTERSRPAEASRPGARYRCQEVRDDADQVLLGRASRQVQMMYASHVGDCPSCQSFDRALREAFRGPSTPAPSSLRAQEEEFAKISQSLANGGRSARPRLGSSLAPLVLALAGALALFAVTRPTASTPGADEIVLSEGEQPAASYAAAHIPDQRGAFGHHAQAFGRLLGGRAELLDEQGRPAAPHSFRRGTQLHATTDAVQLALFGRVLVNLDPGTRARWARATHDLVELELLQGRLAVRYDRRPEDPVLQIRTPTALVRVLGTVFTVELTDDGNTLVSVLRGQVEVLHPTTGAKMAEVEAGYLFDVRGSTYADVGRPEVSSALRLADAAADPEAAARGTVPERWVVPGLSEQDGLRTLNHVPDRAPLSSTRRRRATQARHSPPPPPGPSDEGADLIAGLVEQAKADRRHAMQAALERCRGLYVDVETRYASAGCLEKFMRRYRNEPGGAEGLLLIGMLRMDFAQDYQAATLHFEEFLRRAPDHPRAELAMYKLTLAAIESGQIGLGMRRGRAYLGRYPNGHYVGHILQRFPELRDEI